MYVLFYVSVGIGFVDWLEKEFIHGFVTEYDRPEVTLCG